MSKVAIVTDSTAYLPKELLDQYDISVAPQVLIWGDDTYLDGVDIMPEEFYSRLKTAKVMPTTSQVNPQSFKEIIVKKMEQGYTDILAVLLSSDLSKTIESCRYAVEMVPGASVEIFDSRTTAMAMGFQVLCAARAAQQGANVKDLLALVEKARETVGVVFAVETLEFLHRGGRIGGGKRFLGTVLGVKPILEVTGGKVEAVGSVRTRKKSLERLLDIIEERTKGKTPVRLATLHANAPEEAAEILAQANKRVNAVESIFSEVSPVIGTHAGPGTIGLAYMAGM